MAEEFASSHFGAVPFWILRRPIGGGLGAGPDVGREKGRGGVPETGIVTICNRKTEPIPGLWRSVLKVTKILRIRK